MAMIGLFLTCLFIHACTGVTVILAPVDTARELGKNVTMACVVTDKASSESVQWKHKPEGSDAFNAISFNDNVLSDPTKYGIHWTYNLTIFSLTAADAGLYRCSAGGNNHDATLTVVDLPKNVSIMMIGEPLNGEVHNLSCMVTNGLPTPTINWLINGVDMTANAITENVNTTGGYSDTTSYLPLSLDETMNGRGAECVLSYKGWDSAIKAQYTIQTLFPGGMANSGTDFFKPSPLIYQSGGSNYSSSSSSQYGSGGSMMTGKGVFILRFLKQSRDENINWEIQQSQP